MSCTEIGHLHKRQIHSAKINATSELMSKTGPAFSHGPLVGTVLRKNEGIDKIESDRSTSTSEQHKKNDACLYAFQIWFGCKFGTRFLFCFLKLSRSEACSLEFCPPKITKNCSKIPSDTTSKKGNGNKHQVVGRNMKTGNCIAEQLDT
eukprot:3965195-Amphidinium_carterae.1